MKKKLRLPEPKNKGIIKQIIGPNGKGLRNLEKEAGIKPYDIKLKENKNEVHIVGTETQVKKAVKLVEDIIEKELKRQESDKDEIVVQIPPEKTGLIMGTDGSTVKRIEKETGTTIDVKGKAAHIKGSQSNKKQAANKIKEILEKSSPSTDGKTKVILPPGCELGPILGRNRSSIKKIEEETGAHIEVIDNAIYVSGEPKSCKNARIKIKSRAAEICSKKSRPDQFNFIHANEKCDYKLQSFDCPNPSWNGEKHFKVYKIDDEEKTSGREKLNVKELQDFLYDVLKTIHEEHGGKEFKADFWCHFGHLYIGNVDEADQEKTFSLEELREELTSNKASKNSWRLRFNPAIEELEFKGLEKILEETAKCCTVEPHIRHDFQFFTPWCTSIRAKIFLDKDGKQLEDETFSDQDIDIRKPQPSQVSSCSPGPKYLMCDQFQSRARVNILILSEGMDCRLTIRTVSSNDENDKKVKKFEENIMKYLDKVRIINDEVKMPKDSELPEGYCLYFWRKCKRRSYPYDANEESFSVTISEEDVMDVTESGQKETKTDIHLHCDEWDDLLTSGQWDPEQIVKKLPQFLEFVRNVQSNISEPLAMEDE